MRNTKLESFKDSIKDKRVAIFGLGISNIPLVEFLAASGVGCIECFDRAEPAALNTVFERLKGIDPVYHLGNDYLKDLKGFDIIFKTPIVRYDIPELVNARIEGAVVTSEMEVFCDLCPAEIIAVTGSNGKTTTTTIIHGILKASGFNCWLGGNIGTPLLSNIDEIKPSDKVVLELSSFQLHTMRQRIHTAVITNISPNHLDVHKSYDEYIDAKKNIFRYQEPCDRIVLNADSDTFDSLVKEVNCEVIPFTRKNELPSNNDNNGLNDNDGLFVADFSADNNSNISTIYMRKCGIIEKIMPASAILLPGVHNLENYLAAFAATCMYSNPAVMRKYAEEFNGVPHRLETVRVLNGVTFINDAIASSPSRTIAGLSSFKEKVILIAGGKDKNLDFSELGEYLVQHIKSLYLIGQTSDRIRESLEAAQKARSTGQNIPVIKGISFEEIIRDAYKKALPGDIILLSPASTSLDMFKNFEEKGNLFRSIVNSL